MFNDDAVEGLSFYKKEGAREREREGKTLVWNQVLGIYF